MDGEQYTDQIATWLDMVERGVMTRQEMRDLWRELDEYRTTLGY